MTDTGVVRTVLGDVDPAEIGIVLAHEHVFLDVSARWSADDSAAPHAGSRKFTAADNSAGRWNSHVVRDNLLFSAETDFDVMADEVALFGAAAGAGACLVDLTPLSIGADPLALAEVSRRTGVHIVMGAGYYVHSTHPEWVETATHDELVAAMSAEVLTGRADSGLRAGIIGEIGTSEHLEDCERRVLRAAAVASVRTGAALNVHCNPPAEDVVHEILDIVFAEGSSSDRVYLSHLDEIADEGYLVRVLERGVTVGFDSFGQEGYFSPTWPARTDHDKLTMMLSLAAAGFEHQLVLAQDVCKKQHLSRFGGHGFSHVVERVIPRAVEHFSLDERVANLLLRENARRLITMEPAAR